MRPAAETVRERLAAFVAKWTGYSGSERAEAQTFLNELLACYGTDRRTVGARFEQRSGNGFMDMIWPGVCIVEMKRPSEAGRLDVHRQQAFEYWMQVSRETGNAGRFVVVCAFTRLEVFEPGAFWDRPVAELDLAELPERYESLDFLREREPRFPRDRAELTREAVALVTDLYNRLGDRRAEGPDTLRDFVLQCVWCMFAEDLGMIPERRLSRIVDRLREDHERSSADELGGLFERLNTPGPRPEHGIYAGVPYANGGLFASPAAVHLLPEELELLAEAATFDWKLVEPAIFGSLLEGALGRDRVWAFGAHYTAEADIRKVVGPTIVEPWRERIDACEALDDVAAAARDLERYRVLDPACGSGNFLYVAYRELRRLEARLRTRERELRAAAGLGPGTQVRPYPLDNLYGLELEPFAVRLARVTLWMAHKLAVVELGLDEPVLPLEHLTGVRRADALKVEWPTVDAIVGNPPYIGTKFIRSRMGDDYAEWLNREFGIGLKDYSVYWFRKAHQALPAGGRAGLVATNSIREGQNRQAGLGFIGDNGGVIIDAVSNEDWSGAANVHVSIVNWINRPVNPVTAFRLDDAVVEGITAELRPGKATTIGKTIPGNAGRQFFGVVPVGNGFILDDAEAASIRSRDDADYAAVVRPYLVGDDITSNPDHEPSRWIIDFGELPLEDAMKYPAALDIVRERVKPSRDGHKKPRERTEWWKLSRTVRELFQAIEPLSRFVACPAQAKRFYMVWCKPDWVPSNLTSAFAFSDDYDIGVLTSAIHSTWAQAQSTSLETRPRYTTASFATFPWPEPTDPQRAEIGDLSRRLLARRQEICLERQVGLTRLYNEVDDGAYRDLAELHRRLDEAVAAAYGWPRSAAHDAHESNRRLLDLNREIAAGRRDYRPFPS